MTGMLGWLSRWVKLGRVTGLVVLMSWFRLDSCILAKQPSRMVFTSVSPPRAYGTSEDNT